MCIRDRICTEGPCFGHQSSWFVAQLAPHAHIEYRSVWNIHFVRKYGNTFSNLGVLHIKMSVIQTNARGVDLVELEFYTKGSNQAHLVSRDNLVDATKDYVFGISELLVPNSSLPIFKPGTTQEFFRIKQRIVGAGNTTFADIEINGNTAFDSTFGINDTRNFFSIPQLISELSAWGGTFTEEVELAGVLAANHGGGANIAAGAGVRWLFIDITAGGNLILKVSSDFLNHFLIKASPLAIRLFGLESFVDPTEPGKTGGYIGVTFDVAAPAAQAYTHTIFNLSLIHISEPTRPY